MSGASESSTTESWKVALVARRLAMTVPFPVEAPPASTAAAAVTNAIT